jgi:hypothetical protein
MLSIPLFQTRLVDSGKEILAHKKIMFQLFGRETDWTQGWTSGRNFRSDTHI